MAHAEDKATATFTWKLRLGQDSDNKLIMEGDTNAPFREQPANGPYTRFIKHVI